MRVGCFSIVFVFLTFVAYGLYISWGILAVFIFVALIVTIGTIIYFRLKSAQLNEETTEI